MYLFLIGLLACSTEPTTPVPLAEPVAETEPDGRPVSQESSSAGVEVQLPSIPPSTGEPVPVVLVWEGVSPLHQSFFLDSAAVEQLGRDLNASVLPPANVYVSFDSHRHIGRILLRLLPGTGIDLLSDQSGVLTGVSPVLQALARYRDAVASRYDTRVAAFHIGLDSYRGTTHCRFGAAGPLPPDGTVVDACVMLNGREVCAVASKEGQGVTYDVEARESIERCLK